METPPSPPQTVWANTHRIIHRTHRSIRRTHRSIRRVPGPPGAPEPPRAPLGALPETLSVIR